MREIKFRAWDGEQSRYFYFFIGQGSGCFQEAYDRLCLDGAHFEQFTGNRDKSGKEIYEGDILHTDEAGWVAKVIWSYDGFMLTGLDGKGFSCSPSYKDCTIIGNIHENPELLK